MEKLTIPDYVDLGKCEERFGQLNWSKNDFKFLDEKLKVFKKYENKKFWLVQNLTTGQADFNQFMWLGNQLDISAEKFAREENLPTVRIPTLFTDMDEQLKHVHKWLT